MGRATNARASEARRQRCRVRHGRESGEVLRLFDHVVLLSAPLQTLLDRVTARSSNPYGKRAEDQEEIAGYLETVEPVLRRGATLELDGRAEPARWSQPSKCCCSRRVPFRI